MRILSRKKHDHDRGTAEEPKPTPEPEAPAPEAAAAPEPSGSGPAVETQAGPAGSSAAEPGGAEPTPVEPGGTDPGTGDAAAPVSDAPAEKAEPAPAVEEELARVEEEAASEQTEIRLKAADLLGPDLREMHRPKVEEPEVPVDHAEVISLANQKGGVAKTTTTLNLAVALAELGNRVLCVDLDPQGNLTMSQGIDPDRVEKSMYNVLVDDLPISEVIVKREVDVAVASLDLAGAEIAMSTKIGRERSLEKALKEVQGDYDYICIDTPPSLGLLTINALTASNKVIIPVQCEYLSMRGLVQLQNTLTMIQENLNPDVQIAGILPTMFDSRTLHAREAVSMLEETFGDLVFKSRIRKAVKFAEAPVRGSSVLKYDTQSRAASYYRNLAKEILSDGPS